MRRFRHQSVLFLGGVLVALATGVGCSKTLRVSVTASASTKSAGDFITTPERYLSHIALLAHDELEGRGTGSKGIDLAAGYIAGQYAAAGLKPGGPNGTYFQEFSVGGRTELTPANDLSFDGADALATVRTDYIPFGFSSQASFEGSVVFVGYGIVNPDRNHDDYAGVDVEGKVALMLRRDPSAWNGGSTNHARFDTKVKLAAEKGAVAILIVNKDPGEDGIDGLMRFRSRGADYGLPACHIKRALADTLLAAGGLGTITELQTTLDKNGSGVSAALTGVTARGTVAYESNDILARNVIGVLPGNGPQADEYVVIGGHYDHLGNNNDLIHNGADDNASGTAGVIEVARALANTPHRNRSVLFMAFSGEEMGLLGSKHFVGSPTVDRESIAAMINMDMIGRLNNEDHMNKLAVQGLGTGDSFPGIIERHAPALGLAYLPDDSAKGPSDHAPFYGDGIPSLFFFTGVHSDYHRPGDDTEKVNAEGAVTIVELVYRTALDIINATDAPQFAEVDKPAIIFRTSPSATRSRGVTMGIRPDTDDESDAPGWRIAEVISDGAADKAGMQDGDRILKIDGHDIDGFGAYRTATRGKSPGDSVEVVILRNGKELTLALTLLGRSG